MDFQYGNGVNSRQTTLEAGYNNYNATGTREDFFINKGNEGVRELQQIPVGKAFRGQITDVVGNQVTIRLDNGQSVQAKLAEPMNLNIGDKILFQIKSNAEGLIEIKPIMNGLINGQEATILKALEAAKVPVNEKTVVLLQNLLKEQMPINRNSIQNMYKQILANGNSDVSTIVQMNKYQIPVTKENVGQFEAYKNYEHRIAAEAEQLSAQLVELLVETAEESKEVGNQFHMQLLQMFAGENNELPLQQAKIFNLPESGQLFEEQPANEQKITFDSGQIGFELSIEERQNLFESLKGLPLSEEVANGILKGDITTEVFIKELNRILQQGISLATADLFENDGYKKLLKSQIQSQWFVKPEQLAADEKMQEFYEKLLTQTKQLEGLMNEMGKEASQAAKTAEGMRENIDFMNQLNHMFTYVQIPLMMSGKTAHSDLYVFTKKKNLKEQEGKVSALLHLDMEGLGSLDAYVEMDMLDIKVRFKLADKELVELFEEHIDFLEKRIEERGYRFSSKVEISEETMDFVEDFLARDHGNAPMQRFAFDVRA